MDKRKLEIGVQPKRKKELPCCLRLLKEFSADSSIHGIKYLSDDNRHWTEKTFWAVVMIATIAASSRLVYDAFNQWHESPLLVSFSQKFMNIWDIPFPAITVCPNLDSPGPFRDNKTGMVMFIKLVETMEIFDVKWRKDSQKYHKLFTEILTEEGFCYTFNMMNFYDLFHGYVISEKSAFATLKHNGTLPEAGWALQEGYAGNNPNAYPYRASGSGKNGGLSFKIKRKTLEKFEGYKVAVHLPCELPRFDKHFFRFPSDKTVTLFINPTMIITEDLRFYDATTRQCFFEDEKDLKFFKTYTRSNCQIECLINQTVEHCNCTPFYLPQLNDSEICSENSKCVKSVMKNMTRFNMESNLQPTKSFIDFRKQSCDCLPPCTSLDYKGEISYSDRTQNSAQNAEAKLSIMFRDDDFMFSKRSQVFSFTGLIGNFGGILGLFMGVSLLSFVEMLYFLMFRQY